MISVWKSFTPLEKEKQGGAVLMTLEGTAQETVLELTAEEINGTDGIDKVVDKLDKLYMKDATLDKFETLEAFDVFQRKSGSTIQEHIHEFEKLYNKLKDKGTTMSDDLLAYKLLKSVNLSSQDEKLVKGTTTELTFENMKTQLKRIFPDSGRKLDSTYDKSNEQSLMPNEINEFEPELEETYYQNYRRGGYRGVLYQPRRPPNAPPPQYQPRTNYRYVNPQNRQAVSTPFRYRSQPSQRGRNPTDPRTGNISLCNVCSSPTLDSRIGVVPGIVAWWVENREF